VTLRTIALLLLVVLAAIAQEDSIAIRFNQAEALLSQPVQRASGPGWDLLQNLVKECNFATSPPSSCIAVWDRYGAELEKDRTLDTVKQVETYYRQALDLAERLPASDAAMAPAIELEALAAADLGDQAKAKELTSRALTIRQRMIASAPDAPAASPAPIYRVGGGVSLDAPHEVGDDFRPVREIRP